MNRVIRKYSDLYARRKYINLIRRVLFPRVSNKFLFILCPPYCGSTLLTQILLTSNNTSVTNTLGNKEGQWLPEVKELMLIPERWDENYRIPYDLIKTSWMKYWDRTRIILIEKSPANLMHTKELSSFFENPFFIIMMRNPYAFCEGLMRRNRIDSSHAAKFVVKVFNKQKKNLEEIKNTIIFTYEDLIYDPKSVKARIVGLLPELADIKFDRKFKAHSQYGGKREILDYNTESINRLSSVDIDKINKIFKNHREIFSFFNYPLLYS